jgi:hypothetical protein
MATRFERVDANRLLSATTSLKQLLFGLVFAQADLRMAPRPGVDPVRGLNGTLELKLTEGKLGGVNLLNEMSRLARFVGYSERSEPYTNIVRLTGNMRIQDGVAATDDLKLEFEGGSMGAAGTVGLADQALKLRVTTVIGKEYAGRFGGSRMGGYMTTALANSKGELIIPCLVEGSAAKPRFTPDAGEFARLKVRNLLPGGSPVSGVMGAIEGGGKEGVKGVLDALSGKPAAPAAPAKEPGAEAAAKPAEPKGGALEKGLRDLFQLKKKEPQPKQQQQP